MAVRRRKFLFAGGAVTVLLVAALAAGIWYQFLRSDAPPPVSIEAAVASMHRANGVRQESGAPVLQAGMQPQSNSSGERVQTQVGDSFELSGEWVIAEPSESFAGYRITERLASIEAAEVVGRTTELDGAARIEQQRLETASVTVDMTNVASDQEARDEALETQALETATYSTASFELSQPVKLPESLAEGEAVSVTASGHLTIHGVTRPVDVPLDAQVVNDLLVVVSSFEIALADYGIDQSNAAFIASVEEAAKVELQLYFTPA